MILAHEEGCLIGHETHTRTCNAIMRRNHIFFTFYVI